MENRFDQLVEECLTDLFIRHPALATDSGVHEWDGLLDDFSGEAVSDEISAIRSFKSRFAELPVKGLDRGRRVDHAILVSKLEGRLLELEQIRTHERNPRVYGDLISTGLLPLALFEFAPAEQRLRSVIERENQIPKLLDTARENLAGIPEVLLKTSLDSIRGTLNFVRDDLPSAFKQLKDEPLISEFGRSTSTAVSAIEEFIEELERRGSDPRNSFALGRSLYEARLKCEEGIDISSSELLAVAERELAAAQRAFRETTGRIDSARDPMEVWREVESDHAAPGELANEAREQLASLVAFIKDRHIVTLPDVEPPVVSSSPDF
ncbi:MAG TPA: DUF885 family protein, partial [Blastocatellia bacterium]|nr:DUF885 family protein [Blastocatellia bacterium]